MCVDNLFGVCAALQGFNDMTLVNCNDFRYVSVTTDVTTERHKSSY